LGSIRFRSSLFARNLGALIAIKFSVEAHDAVALKLDSSFPAPLTMGSRMDEQGHHVRIHLWKVCLNIRKFLCEIAVLSPTLKSRT
jgi:hypothetical protein